MLFIIGFACIRQNRLKFVERRLFFFNLNFILGPFFRSLDPAAQVSRTIRLPLPQLHP